MAEPSYLQLFENGKLGQIADSLYEHYSCCTLCPRNCRVNRLNGEKGFCSGGAKVKISSAHAHFGEEPPLVGMYGSGTIFLTHCNLLCIYCQNWDISHGGEGDEIPDEQLASVMLRLQNSRCHNINFVSPTHYLPNIARAIMLAAAKGLHIPIVYNTGGYDRVEILRMLDGIVDIYLPDFKYSDGNIADKFSPGASDYPGIAKAALKEMHRQVGVLKLDKYGIAERGLMIRHLVLPNDLAGTEDFVKFAAHELDPRTYINIMAQYHPAYQANRYVELNRRIDAAEFNTALSLAHRYAPQPHDES